MTTPAAPGFWTSPATWCPVPVVLPGCAGVGANRALVASDSCTPRDVVAVHVHGCRPHERREPVSRHLVFGFAPRHRVLTSQVRRHHPKGFGIARAVCVKPSLGLCWRMAAPVRIFARQLAKSTVPGSKRA